jgi:parallel beta-helix repeat protein
MGKNFALLLVILLLSVMGLGSVCVLPVKAQYQGFITINADGSVSPPTVLIQRIGDTYIVTGNLNITTSNIGGRIMVQRNNSVVEGNGYFVGQILLSHVFNVTVKSFVITIAVYTQEPHGYNGITAEDSSNVTIANNTIAGLRGIYQLLGGMYAGIYVKGGHSNTIAGNTLVNNEHCLYFSGTENNIVIENNIISNQTDLIGSEIVFERSVNNMIFHNNIDYIFTWHIPVGICNSSNIWDIGFPAGGNYWSYYHGKEIENSGIGDTPYIIDANNTDRYPLMKPFNSTFFRLQTTAPKILFEFSVNQTFRESNVPLVFSVNIFSSNKALNWTGYSLDGQQNITIPGKGLQINATLGNLTNGLHGVTVYANDTFGNMGAATINLNVVKPELFPLVTVVIISVVVAFVVVVGLMIYFRKYKHKQIEKPENQPSA